MSNGLTSAPRRPESLVKCLAGFAGLLEARVGADVGAVPRGWRGYTSRPGYLRCLRHDVLEGEFGCLIDDELSPSPEQPPPTP